MDQHGDDSPAAAEEVRGLYVAEPGSSAAYVPVLSATHGKIALIAKLPPGSRVEAVGGEPGWLRVHLSNGRVGFVATSSMRRVDAPRAIEGGHAADAHATAILVSPHGAGARVIAALLALIGLVSIGAGAILSSTAQEQCPFSPGTPVNPYSNACTVTSYPFTALGTALWVVGAVVLLIAFGWIRALRRRDA